MKSIDKLKRITLIILGLSLSAYLMYNGFALLNQEQSTQEITK